MAQAKKVFKCEEVVTRVHIEPSVDVHGHLRNNRADGDGRMEMNVPLAVDHHEIIVHIGNGSPAILDQFSADQELVKAKSCIPRYKKLQIYAAPLLTDRTTAVMIRETRTRNPRNVLFWKAFLSGVSNDGGNSVTDFKKLSDVLTAFYDDSVDAPPMVLHVHAERKFSADGKKRIEVKDREWYAINHDIRELRIKYPRLQIVIKHVSDHRTLTQIKQWRRVGSTNIYVEICPQYLYRCHEDLFEAPGEWPNNGTAFNAHDLCWPIYKNEKSMQVLRETVLAGYDWVMMGTDWACHNDDPSQSGKVKINNDGIVVGGVTILPFVAKSLIIDLFVEAGCIEKINPYISSNARRVHGLPPAIGLDTYDRLNWPIPEVVKGFGPNGTKITAKPFMRGQTATWIKYVPQEL